MSDRLAILLVDSTKGRHLCYEYLQRYRIPFACPGSHLLGRTRVPQLTKGHWAGATPKGHAEPWEAAEVVVDEKKVGVEFEPIKANYDLLNKDMVDSVSEKDLKKIEKTAGVELTRKELRAQLKDMMFIMRTPRGKPLATSHQGLIGRPGRPSKEMLENLVTPKPAAKSRAKKAA